MRRREFISVLGGALAAWPLATRAQQPERMRRVGVLMSLPQMIPAEDEVVAFHQGLTALGWVEGRNIRIEFRWPGGDVERARAFAKELVGLNPDVLVGRSTPTTAALKQETTASRSFSSTWPNRSDQASSKTWRGPAATSPASRTSRARSGASGCSCSKEVDPHITRVAIIYNPQTAPFAGSFLRSVESAAPLLAVEAIATPVQNNADIESALPRLRAARRRSGRRFLTASRPASRPGRSRRRTITACLPCMPYRAFALGGGSCLTPSTPSRSVPTRHDLCRPHPEGREAVRLPVQLPTKFDMVINLKTARTLGLEVPPTALRPRRRGHRMSEDCMPRPRARSTDRATNGA